MRPSPSQTTPALPSTILPSRRTLIIGPSAVDEAILAQPLIALLRRHAPVGLIDCLAPPETAPVFRLMGELDEVLECPVSDEQLAQQPDRARTDDTVLDGIDTRRMWAAVAALPERCQRLLRIIAFDDRPDYAGVARDLHMPIGSIGPTRRRCLDKLRLELEGA